MNLKKQQEEMAVSGIQVVNKFKRALYISIAFIAVGCSVGTKVSDTDEQKAQREIDYTLYDLTYVEGIKQKMLGNLGEAIDKFEDAIEINPNSDAANYQISLIAAMRRDEENAIKYGSRAVRMDPQNQWYHMNMANIYIQQSKLDSAAVWIEKAVQVDPYNESEKYRLGNIYMQTGQEEKAEKIFTDFNNKYPGNEQIIMALINVKLELGKYEEAEALIIDELEKNDENLRMKGILAKIYSETGEKEKAERLYGEIMSEDEYDLALDFSYMEFLMKNNEYEKLLQRTDEIIKNEKTATQDKIGLVARLMEDSVVVKNYGEELVKIGQELQERNKDNPGAAVMVAEIYRKMGKKEEEIKALTDYVENHEEQYYVWEQLLLRLNELNDVERIYTYAGKAATLFNRAPLPKILYAYSLIEKEKYNEAEGELRKVRILVNNEEQYLVQILSMEGEIAYRKGNIKEATKKFDEALKIEPENALVLNNYAYYLAVENIRLGEAEDMIEKCLRIEENITYLDTYAWVLYKRGRYKEAEKVMQRIFRSGNIRDAELLEHYGYIKKAVGDCEEAVILWQTALRMDQTKKYLIEEIRKCVERN
ncbi:MAG: tetratricopeptide repeat protein [Bacteroidota bacterium]|nr:tetratricopeptide repeat protein [Bacteroidota bacterium]